MLYCNKIKYTGGTIENDRNIDTFWSGMDFSRNKRFFYDRKICR